MPTSDEWVVVQLSPRGEEEEPEALLSALKRITKAEVFLPVSISKAGESQVVHKLVEGYVFLRRTEPDHAYFKLEQTRYLDQILTSRTLDRGRSSRKIETVSNEKIETLRKQIQIETEQGIQLGDTVFITDGPYSSIYGTVIEEIPELDSVQVHIKLRSKEAAVTLPRSFLKFTSKGNVSSFSPFETKISRISAWLSSVTPILTWRPPSFVPIMTKWRALKRLAQWEETRAHQETLSWFKSWAPPVKKIQADFSHLGQLTEWANRGRVLFEQARVGSYTAPVQATESKLQEISWFQDVLRRIEQVSIEVESIERTLSTRSPDMIQNILVDGHNLAYRCFHAMNAPGAKPLTDSQGRPTSIVHGVLKSLGALQKKYSGAQIYVCWDGSPQRRKALCPEYKANRPERSLENITPEYNQIAYLKETLPFLGVCQTYVPEEETDDLIACLVRGKLAGQNNIIVSSDHDFLQLVTRTDTLLTPKSGPKQEVLYDPDKVMAEYGVLPSKMVALRALTGDTSDNLKGVPRVPTKVLAALVNAHETVEGIYASGLSGVSPNQYDKIRASEKQVRLNAELMQLKTDIIFEVVEASPDPEEAVRRLEALDIQAEPITKAFFREMKGFEKHS